MSYKKIHLHLAVQPTPTPTGAIDYACAIAQAFEAKLGVSSPRLKISMPSHWLARGLMAGMAREIESAATARGLALEAHLTQKKASVPVQLTQVVMQWPYARVDSNWYGRTSDLCVLGLPRDNPEQRFEVEEWLFGVGRPCLLYPEDSLHVFSLDTVVIGWDFSKSASRAIGDAIPILRRAKQVRAMVVRGEKDIPQPDVATPLIEFLAAHGIACSISEYDIEERTVGQAILDQATRLSASLVVLGAFGRSRLKEFLLGGATKGVLDASRIPLFMSH